MVLANGLCALSQRGVEIQVMGICASANRKMAEPTPQNHEDTAAIPAAKNQVPLLAEILNCPDSSMPALRWQDPEPRKTTTSEVRAPLERCLSDFLGMSPLKENTKDLQTTIAGT